MKTSIAYLPQHKQDQLQRVVQVIMDAVNPEKIILFGSYARDKWVEDTHMEGHILHEYISDYDILVVARRGETRPDGDIEDMLEARCLRFSTPVSIIVHTIDYVNTRLSEGQYFFSDVKEEGILLYDAGNIPLAEPRALTPAERQAIAIEDFKHWFGDASGFLKGGTIYKEINYLNIAAFSLHQATERAYAAVLLVFTGYKPRTHNIGKLLRSCKEFIPELATIFPQNTPEEVELFKLLKKAYVDARYKKTYVITEEELNTLTARVQQTHAIVERVCMEQITKMVEPDDTREF